MAGDWIKMRCNLWTHPNVVRIASALSVTRCAVIGALHGAWSVFDQHADQGMGLSMTRDGLDSLIETPGMCDAMQSVGWLEERDGVLYLPRYEEHNGPTAKRRAQESKRKQVSRSSTRSVRTNADKMRTRKEKRREDIHTAGAVCNRRFTPPSVAEVEEYSNESGWLVDAEAFVAFYQSKGWMVGKNKMKDWRAAVRGWSQREKKHGHGAGQSGAQRRQDANAAAFREYLAGDDENGVHQSDGDALRIETNG